MYVLRNGEKKQWRFNSALLSFCFISMILIVTMLSYSKLGEEQRIGFDFIRRRLLGYQSIADPRIILLGNVQEDSRVGKLSRAYRHIFSSLSKQTSKMLVYPYAFDVGEDAEASGLTEVAGSVLELRPTSYSSENWEEYINSQSYQFLSLYSQSIQLHKSMALFDGDIAVLRVDSSVGGKTRDLTWESVYYHNALHAFLGHYNWDTAASWIEYIKNPNALSSVVTVNASAVNSGFLLDDLGEPRFAMLILPDHISGQDKVITGALQSTALKEYLNKGGFVYSSGKSAVLLQTLGLISPGTVDKNKVLRMKTGNRGASVPCGELAHSYSFERNLMCMGLMKDKDDRYMHPLLTIYRVDGEKDPNLEVLMNWDSNASTIIQTQTGLGDSELEPDDNPPMLLHKAYGSRNGQILINLAQSLTDSSYSGYPLFLNALFMALSKPVIVQARCEHHIKNKYVDPDVFPYNEAGIEISLDYEIRNLYDVAVGAATLDVAIHNGFELLSTPAECVFYNTSQIQLPITNPEDYIGVYRCVFDEVEALEDILLNFALEIVEPDKATAGHYITVSWATFTYSNLGVQEEVALGYMNVRAFMAARLVGDYNVDPSGLYPLLGYGDDVNAVIAMYNVENTDALDYKHVAIIPLVTPVFDSDDQTKFALPLDFFDQYYDGSTNGVGDYHYPLSTGEFDYLDYKLLAEKGVHLSAEWHDPVTLSVENRLDVPGIPNISSAGADVSSIGNVQYTSDIDTANEILKQSRYIRSVREDLFEHAHPRLFAFIDSTRPEGSAARWNGTVPPDRLNPNYPFGVDKPVAKREILFMRADVAFLDTTGIPLPNGLANRSTVVTLDEFPNPPCNTYKNSSSYIFEEGTFVFNSTAGNQGLTPEKYSNALLDNCHYQPINADDISAYSGGNITMSHYVIPISPEMNIKNASDVLHFKDDGTFEIQHPSTGKFVSYSISLKRMYFTAYTMIQKETMLGGKLKLNLGNVNFGGKDPVAEGLVTFAVEHIAIYKTVWGQDNSITIYFRRGLNAYERYGKDSEFLVSLEDVSGVYGGSDANFTAGIEIHALSYDFTSLEFDKYVIVRTDELTFCPGQFMKLPALRVEYGGDGTLLPRFGRLLPFVRYTRWYQELQHRQLYGLQESSHVTHPGVTTTSERYSAFATTGTDSIPYADYLEKGISRMIPFTSETSRLAWRDIWGRSFAQPVRTTLIDAGAARTTRGGTTNYHHQRIVRNMMITMTYQLLDRATGDRQQYWHSDLAMDAHMHIKLLNNYPKYFDPTACESNRALKCGADTSRVFDPAYDEYVNRTGVFNTSFAGEYTWVSPSYLALWGMCWNDIDHDVMEAQALSTLSEACKSELLNTSVCPGTEANCTQRNPTACGVRLRRVRKETEPQRGVDFNYAGKVAGYYPSSYIEPDMWDLSREAYHDSWYHKGYPFHMDNELPSFDNDMLQPENLIELRLYKGFGFDITYDPEHLNPSLEFTGWWSDNLQLKDDTLLAGQDDSNPISVDKYPLVDLFSYVRIDNLRDCDPNATTAEERANERLKNFYVCEFNRYRRKLDANDTTDVRAIYPKNVLYNHIVPVPADPNSESYTQYSCDLTSDMYTPTTVSGYQGNILKTNGYNNYMYFGAALRGGAKETINVVVKMDPPDEVEIDGLPHYEGTVKINDGAYFTYHNPANGPNSFTYVFAEPNIATAMAVDIYATADVIPTFVTTTCSEFYALVSLEDPQEVGRKFSYSAYIDEFGYGDVVTRTYVGDSGTLCSVMPGGHTIVRVELVNNAGFDWCLKMDAIESPTLNKSGFASSDCLRLATPDVQDPSKYNFLKLIAPSDIAPYVTIAPSLHMKGVKPVFFDFLHVNVPTIRDGFRGTYFFDVSFSDDIPDNLRGRVHTFNFDLETDYFDMFPGEPTDPLNPVVAPFPHDYTVEIPPALIGVFDDDEEVYWTMGRGNSLNLSLALAAGVAPVDSLLLTSMEAGYLRDKTTAPNPSAAMRTYYESLQATRPPVNFTLADSGIRDIGEETTFAEYCSGFSASVDEVVGPSNLVFDLDKHFSEFPIPIEDAPSPFTPATSQMDVASLYLALRLQAGSLPFGIQEVASGLNLEYTDFAFIHKSKNDSNGAKQYNVDARGASLLTTFKSYLIDGKTRLPLVDQWMLPNRTNYVRLEFTAENDGSNVAFAVRLRFNVGKKVLVDLGALAEQSNVKNAIIETEPLANGTSMRVLKVDTGKNVEPGVSMALSVDLMYDTFDYSENDTAVVSFLSKGKAVFDLSSGGETVMQDLSGALSVNISVGVTTPENLALEVHTPLLSVLLGYLGWYNWQNKVVLVATVAEDSDYFMEEVSFVFQRKLVEDGYDWETLTWTSGTETDVERINGIDVDYRVCMMRQPDEASQFYMVGVSDVWVYDFIDVRVLAALACMVLLVVCVLVLILAIVLGVVQVGALVGFFLRKKQAHYVEETFPYHPLATDKIDKTLATKLNREYRRNTMRLDFKRVEDGVYELDGRSFAVELGEDGDLRIQPEIEGEWLSLDDYLATQAPLQSAEMDEDLLEKLRKLEELVRREAHLLSFQLLDNCFVAGEGYDWSNIPKEWNAVFEAVNIKISIKKDAKLSRVAHERIASILEEEMGEDGEHEEHKPVLVNPREIEMELVVSSKKQKGVFSEALDERTLATPLLLAGEEMREGKEVE